MVASDAQVVEHFLRQWEAADKHTRQRFAPRGAIPVSALQRVALSHQDPWIRRKCLDTLDHHAADVSTPVFLAALDDPVAPVREVALHSLACERCRSEAVCISDVVPRVIRVLNEDVDAEVRYKALPILRQYAGRYTGAMDALVRASEAHVDPMIRAGARLALSFAMVPARNDLIRRMGRRGKELDRESRLGAAT